MNNESLSARAYGLLWLYTGTDDRIHEARRLLLKAIGPEQQKRGITQAQLDVMERQR